MLEVDTRQGAPKPPRSEKLATSDIAHLAASHGVVRHLTMKECIFISGMSRSSLYRALNRGDLVALKAGCRSVIPIENLRRFMAALPQARFGKEARRAKQSAAA